MRKGDNPQLPYDCERTSVLNQSFAWPAQHYDDPTCYNDDFFLFSSSTVVSSSLTNTPRVFPREFHHRNQSKIVPHAPENHGMKPFPSLSGHSTLSNTLGK